jgi:hypothetical protein
MPQNGLHFTMIVDRCAKQFEWVFWQFGDKYTHDGIEKFAAESNEAFGRGRI